MISVDSPKRLHAALKRPDTKSVLHLHLHYKLMIVLVLSQVILFLKSRTTPLWWVCSQTAQTSAAMYVTWIDLSDGVLNIICKLMVKITKQFVLNYEFLSFVKSFFKFTTLIQECWRPTIEKYSVVECGGLYTRVAASLTLYSFPMELVRWGDTRFPPPNNATATFMHVKLRARSRTRAPAGLRRDTRKLKKVWPRLQPIREGFIDKAIWEGNKLRAVDKALDGLIIISMSEFHTFFFPTNIMCVVA